MAGVAQALIDDARERVRREYRRDIGRPESAVATPALILDIAAARRNIKQMAIEMAGLPSVLRPHVKVHKSPDLVQIQADHGMSGVTTATVWEAAVMIATGVDDVFVANTVTGLPQARFAARLSREHRVSVAVDDLPNAEWLSDLAVEAGGTLGVLVEVDTGMDRAGVDTADEALRLARGLIGLPGLRFEGITGYEGHCSGIVDDDERAERHREAMTFFVGVADALAADGIAVPIRSAGGTSTWKWTAAFPGITEIQAGSYVVMDNFHGRMIKEFEHAVTVATTVVSRPPDRVVIDAGNKTVAVPHLASLREVDLPNLRFNEEHGIFGVGAQTPRLGERLHVIPGYAPTTINVFDAYHVVEDGVVVDVWPVVPRGPGHHGLDEA
jgi:D-serine deaminase-like pyridoxal phosphate-dependent protein